MRRGLPPPPLPAAAQNWALFLDVDGTLLDLAPSPDAVQVPSTLIGLLAQLQTQLGGALALISGRSIATLDRLFEPLRLAGAGLHGFGRRDTAGLLHRQPIDAAALARLRAAASGLVSDFPGILVEDKHYAVALHYHRTAISPALLQAAVESIASDTGFEMQRGRDVFELKPAAVNKGEALTAFLAEPPFAGRLPVFLGDDLTDEHALVVTHHRGGLAIQVGDRPVGAARFALPDPTAVSNWLQQWGKQLP